VVSKGITFKSNFVNVGQLIQKLKEIMHTDSITVSNANLLRKENWLKTYKKEMYSLYTGIGNSLKS